MQKLLKNWRIQLWIAFIIVSIFSIMFVGIQYGIDFKGGTLFQIQLAEKPNQEELQSITSIIQRRIDSFGLKDSKVNAFGDQFVIVQIAETDPKEVENLELLLKTQGKFEATLDGNILFDGSEIIQIIRDPTQYGVQQSGTDSYSWTLPFTLSQAAAERFSRLAFHQCTIISFSPGQGNQYDCKQTYFFIDRPHNAALVMPKSVFDNDSALFFSGSFAEAGPAQTVEDLLKNANIPYFAVEDTLSEEQLGQIKSSGQEIAVVHPSLDTESKNMLKEAGFPVKEIEPAPTEQNIPWTWKATGARTTIALTAGVANLEPFVENVQDARIFSDLFITGGGTSLDNALSRLTEMDILLKTGSLPIPIESISKETVSPLLGREFLDASLFIGLIALFCVMIVLFVRYRRIGIALPIAITGLSEVIIILGFSSFFKINLDLASVAGILTVIGTGVNQQIIITDELLSGEGQSAGSLGVKSKRAFFILMASASTLIATMLPMIFFGFGLGKLVGFAITTILGVLVGVLIARPAFNEVAKYFLEKEQA